MIKYKIFTEEKESGIRTYCKSSGHAPEEFTKAEALTVLDSIKAVISEKFYSGIEELASG